MEYKILTRSSHNSIEDCLCSIEKEVNSLFFQGWKLYGNLRITVLPNSYTIVTQEMIKN